MKYSNSKFSVSLKKNIEKVSLHICFLLKSTTTMLKQLIGLFENPSKKFKKETTTYLSNIYTMAYGIFYLESISKPFKYFWTAYILVSPTIQICSIIGYCCLSPNPLNFEDYVISALCLLRTSIPVFTQLSLKFFSHKVREVLEVVDEDVDAEFKEISTAEEETVGKLRLSPFLRIFVLFYAIVPFSFLVQLLGVLMHRKNYNTLKLYFFPMPGLHKVDSPVLYSIIYTIQCMLMLLSAVSLFENLIFIDVLMSESDKEFRRLRNTIKANADTFKNQLKSIYRADLKNPLTMHKKLLNKYKTQLAEKKRKICNNLIYNLILCIRCHQKLMKLVLILTYYINKAFFF